MCSYCKLSFNYKNYTLKDRFKMKKLLRYFALILLVFSAESCIQQERSIDENYNYPLSEREREYDNKPNKNAKWTPEQAAHHQKVLAKLTKFSKASSHSKSQMNTSYANGALEAVWRNRGPKNMPGAFKFAEMLDGTDVIYGVTWNHYADEYNSTSYIYKGTVYNPTTGVGGDDFQLLTGYWPNRYENLFAFEVNGNVRLVAHIENGPLYYSDDEGQNWILSNGLPESNMSSTMNRQDNNKIYVNTNTSVYVSEDNGMNFSLLQNFGSSANSFVYSPRYIVQGNADNVYLVRSGDFYKLNDVDTGFDFVGSYTNNHGNSQLSIGGDSRTLYVTENNDYWVSVDEGLTWTEKFPHGNWYGDTSGKMSSGEFFSAHPEDPNICIGGYAIPVISTDALNSVLTDETGWGNYQNGNNLSVLQYQNRIRFNYHPDFQSSQFFYNSSGDVLSARCSDGGIYISYKEWSEFPNPGVGYNNTNYANAHFININVLNTITPLVYRESLFTGANNPDHINFGTQDQGSQSIINGTSGDVLDFYQVIGGDGPSIDSYDGIHAWRWARQGDMVWPPVPIYWNGTGFQSIGAINGQFNSTQAVNFSSTSDMGWVQTYIDRDAPDKTIWLLSKSLHRADWNSNVLTGHSVSMGQNQVAALAQGNVNPDKLFMLQDGNVYISNDRGNTFGPAINTPFSQTPGGWTKGDIGSGVVFPGNDERILFCGPSSNNVGCILSNDGGNTWIDITGDFPAGPDAQTGGMIITPNGEFVFAGTDIGAYVFDVEQEEWFSLAEGIGFFNTVDIDYIEEINTVRFATFGSGVLDFQIEEMPVGIEENSLDVELEVYPNPVNDNVKIRLGTPVFGEIELNILNLNGEVVYAHRHSFSDGESLNINTAKFAQGVYIIKLTSDQQQIATRKLIIK